MGSKTLYAVRSRLWNEPVPQTGLWSWRIGSQQYDTMGWFDFFPKWLSLTKFSSMRRKLQRMQNAVTRITVSQNSSFPLMSTTALLCHLHRLPIDSHISFKLTSITFKALGSGRPPYLARLLHNYSPPPHPPRTMRSSSAKLLRVPRYNLSLGSRAFSISVPTECP